MRTVFNLLLVLFLSSSEAYACKCDFVPVSMESIKQYELIFYGEVVAISGCDKTAKATFTIKELYRGKTFANTQVEFDCSSSCAMNFAPGQTWLIFSTYKKYGEAEVGFCSHSRERFAEGTEDYNASAYGMSFAEEQEWLKKNLGIQSLNEKSVEAEQHHENIRPGGSQTLIYLGVGLLAVVLFYFIGRKFLK